MVLDKGISEIIVGFKFNDDDNPIDGIDYRPDGKCLIYCGEYEDNTKTNGYVEDKWR